MARIGESPLSWLHFDERGALSDPEAAAEAAAMVAGAGIGDVVVLSHGWKNDQNDARRLYTDLWVNTCASLKRKEAASIAICAVVWPAKAYANDMDDTASSDPDRALSAGGGDPPRDLTDDEFEAAIADFSDVFGHRATATIVAARIAASGIDSGAADALFATACAASEADAPRDSELRRDAAPIASPMDAQALLLGLAAPPDIGTAAAGTRNLGEVLAQALHGPRAATARFLNQLTYFEMKTRAGLIGARLGSEVLPKVMGGSGVRLHLVGHSFGARLVTAAAADLPDGTATRLDSLTLLQGAFSHNALATEVESNVPGAFAKVVGRPKGPIAMTHTHNDRATTFWYPLASRLSRDISQGFGDKDDVFGAMGANGAQKLPAGALAPDVVNENFDPKAGKVNRFLADGYVRDVEGVVDAHNNVANPTVGRLLAAVIETPV